MIEVTGLSKWFNGKAGRVTAVDDLSFTVAAGEVFGLLGPNGARQNDDAAHSLHRAEAVGRHGSRRRFRC